MIKALLKAIKLAEKVLADLCLKPGMTEKQVASHITHHLKHLKSKPAFRIIVASGKRAALPHGFATNKKIRLGELVVVDLAQCIMAICRI